MKCARPTCNRKAQPKRNRGLCHQHYARVPIRGYVDSAAARKHIALLRSRGMTLRMLTAAGISRFGVRSIEKNSTIRALTEAKVLAIPVPERISSGAPVDATGTVRRIKALVALGWPQAMIAEQIGTTQTAVSALTRRERVTSETAIAVRDLFGRWGMTVGPSMVSRQRARQAGWVTGLAWDDIDDPDETADVGVRVQVSFSERVGELRDLGVTDIREIADRLGIKAESVERQLIREKAA